jgi:hypothetical protein
LILWHVLLLVPNIIVVIVSDYDRSIRHFFIGDDDYAGGVSGGVMMMSVITKTKPVSEQNVDGSLYMEEVIGTKRLRTGTPSSFNTTGCL